MEQQSDRTTLQALVDEMAGITGPLEVWRRLLSDSAAAPLPAAATLEELNTFVDTALPDDDSIAHADFAALACGLSPARAYTQHSDACLDKPWLFMETLRPVTSILSPPPSENKEAAILEHIRHLEDELQDWALTVSRCVSEPDTGAAVNQGRRSSPVPQEGALFSQAAYTEHSRLPEVLDLELRRLLTWLTIVLESLASAADILEGRTWDATVMDDVCNALSKNEVPASWDVPDGLESYAGTSLTTWQEAMHDRVHFFCEWFIEGPPLSFWLGGFTSPKRFMMSLLQQHSKNQEVELDKLHLNAEATAIVAPLKPSHPEESLRSSDVHRPAEGALVHGLALCGARWASNVQHGGARCSLKLPGALDFSKPDKTEAPWLPLLHLVPSTTEEHARRSAAFKYYSCPVYRRISTSPSRQVTPLLSLDLASMQDPMLWTLRGVALFFEPLS
jgi:hypothetical protein